MSRTSRITAATRAGWHSFLRRRTAVFFTFFFPAIIVVIFGVLVQTQSGGGGLFAEPPSWYIAGYIAVVVLFTPLSRVGSEVSRQRDGSQFEKLATTPLRRWEWLLAQTVVNTTVIGLASFLLLGLLVAGTSASIVLTAELWLVVPFVVVGTALFCAVGAMLGSFSDSRDGVIAASNGLAVPLLFLSEAFVSSEMLPGWLPLELSPMTYLTRGLRAVTYDGTMEEGVILAQFPASNPYFDLGVLCLFAAVLFVLAARSLPQTE
ncbi:ABC-2 type transport system permease protein [Halovenus aranensis]|uniref:ABC-2 type transport system permease protein n=1 Tax=Halovenus aranensis TaxID=890420 RepID=A0A1G8U8K6_9EURY|nr:ABC transporter permease [Halovenus aranensis]SDJ49465.1 ABC-2 type transport system permease protein [Halovenus aranensis]